MAIVYKSIYSADIPFDDTSKNKRNKKEKKKVVQKNIP